MLLHKLHLEPFAPARLLAFEVTVRLHLLGERVLFDAARVAARLRGALGALFDAMPTLMMKIISILLVGGLGEASGGRQNMREKLVGWLRGAAR
ncbi:MAG: hypothetical protein KJZ69_18325 [Phycisphaerales bacterium]|nr:hypothetical protein [Phycisphaerales bacterium]